MKRIRLRLQGPKGARTAQLRRQQYHLLRRFQLPEALVDMLPGSLSMSRIRCGKPTCHCAQGEGHPNWTLTFMQQGSRQVTHIPREWVEDIGLRVAAGRAFQDAVREVLAANAQLMRLARKPRRR